MDHPDCAAPPGRESWLEDERLIRRFERAWEAGERPNLADYLPANAGARATVLVELVHAELEYRTKAGEPVRAEEYLRDYPELAVDRATALELIRSEWTLRRR